MSGHNLTPGRLLTYTLALLLTSTSVSAAVRELNSINDLKKIDFGGSVPKHSLLLLHWFANMIEMDNNHVIHLTFEPNEADYGAHHYGNFERMLERLPKGHRYYTLGNLNSALSSDVRLPSYVTRSPYHLMGNEETNRDRIILRVNNNINILLQTDPTIDQVYITQHYGVDQDQGTRYDPAHTYRITTNLLREIRRFSTGGNQHSSLREIREHFGSDIDDLEMAHLTNTWGNLACVGLLLFIVITERHSPVKSKKQRPQAPPADRGSNASQRPNVPSTSRGSTNSNELFVVNWPDLPSAGRGSTASQRSHVPSNSRGSTKSRSHVVVNMPGSHVPSASRGSTASQHSYLPSASRGSTKSRSHIVVNMPEYIQTIPQAMKLEVGTGAKGKAMIHWSNIPENHLDQDVMAVLFKNDGDRSSSKVFKCIGDSASGTYQTSVPLNPGLQVRLHRARRWCCGLWTTVGEELTRGPEFDDAEAQQRVQIRGYDAQLQLFMADGKACARLYVGKTFTDWRKLFRKSWVGFYSSPSKAPHDYESWRWQWATRFTRSAELEDMSYRVYEYHSGMTIAPGVLARFILSGVEDVLARTSPWNKSSSETWFH